MTTQPSYRRKLIEVDLPLDDINRESAREKSIRHGHPSTMHLWWARRPLAACRAVIFASMVDDPSSYLDDAEEATVERKRLHDLLKRLVVWENSNDANLLAEARWEIARSVARSRDETLPDQANPDEVIRYLGEKALPIYDPFCGGGSIPLEAQRLGMRAVGSDLNPVAVLITKALIELPSKFANNPPANPEADPMGMTVGKGKKAQQVPWRGTAGLADDIRYYGRKMREMAWEQIGHLYPTAQTSDNKEVTVIAWLWARTVPCPNPACGIQMPLVKTFQLSKKQSNEHWARPIVDPNKKTVSYVVQDNNIGVPTGATVSGKGAVWLACNSAVQLDYVREQGVLGNMGQQLTAIVAEGDRKRLFLSPDAGHTNVAMSARPSWRPSGNLPGQARSISVQIYGFTQWNQLFTDRQLTALTTFSDLLTEVRQELIHKGVDHGYVDAVCTYLALAIGRKADACSSFATWQNVGDKVAHVFTNQGIPMIWDFAEANAFSSSTQNWMGQVNWVAEVVERLPFGVNPGEAHQADASTTVYSEEGPVIVTDPPYYGQIHFADSSDYFYVWLRSLLRDTYPELFASILVPKEEEMVASQFRFENPRERFEELLSKTLNLIRERCSPEFPSSIFYAYKQQEEEREGRLSTGWDTMLSALVSASFQIIGTWPIRTERSARSNAQGTNALASSVVLVCRPRPDNAPTATRRQFLDALEAELPRALDQLTHEGHIAPVDLAQAAIGPGMQIYSRYRRVETISGEQVPVREALAHVNRVIAEYHERQQGELDSQTQFCLEWFQQYGYDNGFFGVAEDLARAKAVSVDALRDASGLLTASAGIVQLLPLEEYGPERHLRLGEMTAWEGTFRMAYHLTLEDRGGQGINGAANVYRAMGGNAESVERLARILYNHYDRKGDSRNSVIFNNLVTEWPAIQARSQETEQGRMI